MGVSVGEGAGVDVDAGVSVASGEVVDFLFFDFDGPFSAVLGVSSACAAGEAECLVFGRGDVVGEGEDFRRDSLGEGVSFFELVAFFFFREGVGVGVDKTFLMVSPIDCSASTGAETETIRSNVMIIRAKITPTLTRSVRHFLKDGLVDANAGVEIFERKIFVG